jgi:hypothetical protein
VVEHRTENAGVISSTLILGTYCRQIPSAGKPVQITAAANRDDHRHIGDSLRE